MIVCSPGQEGECRPAAAPAGTLRAMTDQPRFRVAEAPVRGSRLAWSYLGAVVGLVVGVVLGLLLQPTLPVGLQPYLPIAIVAALDALFGAFRAYLEGTFTDRVFVVSFISNVLIAALIVWVGDQIGVGSQLSTGVVVVLGIRIFSNVAAIRRHLFHA